MDVIEYKLASNNPILISHGIWKLLETVKQKVENGEEESKITELKFLLSQCKSNNGIVCKTACQAIIALVQSGVLTVSPTVTNLTASLVAAEHCGAVASAICNLLSLELQMSNSNGEYVCPFNLKAPEHPLITVLVLKKDVWRDVLNHVRTMMNHCNPELVDHHVTLLRPVFLYILCNPTLSVSENCRQNAWNLLMKTGGMVDLQIEILQWLRTKRVECCIDTNSRIVELAEIADAYEYRELCSALIPLIMSMALEILRHGGDPRSNLDTITTILGHGDPNIGSVVVCLLAEMISISPSVYLLDIVTMAATILEETWCNRIVAHTLIASIVQWMAYPSILSSDALDAAKRLMEKIPSSPPKINETQLIAEKPLDKLWQSDANIQFYAELCSCADSWTPEKILPWLERLSKIPAYAIANYKLIIGAIFLESRDTNVVVKTCEMLVEIAKKGGQVLPVILHKLTKTRDVSQVKTLLFSLPELTGLKENVPIVMHTLKTLSAAEKPLNYVAIELYVRALAVEPRCHRYIQTALNDLSDSDRSWQSDVTCARAMLYICERHSEHGAELVPLMSRTLSRSSANRSGGAASALVLKGISALCVAGVTEISSTWRVLSPKLSKERRSIVLRALCDFLGNVPDNPSQDGPEFGNLVVQVLTKLWDYAYNSRDIETVEAAFKALSAYKLETMPLSVLPAELRSCIEAPEIIADNATSPENSVGSTTAPENPSEDAFAPIPASHWIAMLVHINPSALTHAGNFLRHLIQEELYGFRSGIYRWSHGEPVNFKYLSEKSTLRAVGERIRHYEPRGDADEERIILECLRIFAHKYPKPLPPIQWRYFGKAIGVSACARKYGIFLAAHQAQISPTAKDFLEKHLTEVTKDWNATSEQLVECLDLYGKLDDICRAVGSNVLAPYLETSVNSIVEKAKLEKEEAVGMFEKVMNSFTKTLKDELIHNDNRSLLTDTLEKLLDRVDADSKMFESYTNAVVELTAEQVERMTLPGVWLKVTEEKLKKAVKIRAQLVLRKNVQVPLTWMNEIIRATASSTAVHASLLEEMQKILPQMRLEKSNANWTLDLMRWIGSLIVDAKETANIETASFLCEILFITVVCLSATDCLLVNDCALATSHDVRSKLFPQALASIVQTAYWKDIVPQTMEWLNHMRTTPIPRMYKIVFHNALVSLKNEGYFDVMWTKCLSTRAPIHAS